MKFISLSFLFVIYCQLQLFAQKDIDKISNLISKGKLEKAILLAEKIEIIEIQQDAYYIIAEYLTNINEKVKAIEYYKKSITVTYFGKTYVDPHSKHYNDYCAIVKGFFHDYEFELADKYMDAINSNNNYFHYYVLLNNNMYKNFVAYNTQNKSIATYYFYLINELMKDYYDFEKEQKLIDYIKEEYPDSIPSVNEAFLYCLGNKTTKLNINCAEYFINNGANKHIIPALLRFNKELLQIMLNTPNLLLEEDIIEFLNMYPYSDIPEIMDNRPKDICGFFNELIDKIDTNKIDIKWFYKSIANNDRAIFRHFLNNYSELLVQKNSDFLWIKDVIENLQVSDFENVLNVFPNDVFQDKIDLSEAIIKSKKSNYDKGRLISILDKKGIRFNLSASEYVELLSHGSSGGIEQLKNFSQTDQNYIFYHMVIYYNWEIVNWLLENTEIDFNYRPAYSTSAPNIVELALLLQLTPNIIKYADSSYHEFQASLNSYDKDTLRIIMTKRQEIYSWIMKNCSFIEEISLTDYSTLFLTKILPNIIFLPEFDMIDKDENARIAFHSFLSDIDHFFGAMVRNSTNVYDFEEIMNSYNSYLFYFYYDYVKNNLLREIDSNSELIFLSQGVIFKGENNYYKYKVNDQLMEEILKILKGKVDFSLVAPISYKTYNSIYKIRVD